MPLARRRCISCLAIFAYVFSGLSITLVNKIIVRDSGLHAPALVSSTGALFIAAVTRLLVWMGRIQVKPIKGKSWEFAFCRALPVGVLAAGSLCFGNMSYIFLDPGFVQMLKAGTPALLLLVLSVLRVEQVSASTAGLALLMVVGSSLASLQQPNATAIGLVVQFASQLCEVLQCTAMQVFLQKLDFEASDAGYYLSPAIAACCLLPSLILEWPHVIAAHKVGLLFQQIPLLIASGAIGMVVNFSSNLVIKFTSSLLAKLLVIARSAALVLLFIGRGEAFTWLQVVGYIITLSAFAGFSIVKAREMEQQALADARAAAEESSRETDLRDSDDDPYLVEPPSPTSVTEMAGGKEWDLTTSMFWFAICVVLAGAYQALVIGDVPSQSGLFHRVLLAERHRSVAATGMPPTPYLEPITAGVRAHALNRFGEEEDQEGGMQAFEHGGQFHTVGAINVQSPAKVMYMADGRFLLHSANGSVSLGSRTPESVLSSSWMISSKQFGTVYLASLNSKGQVNTLSCDLKLVPDLAQACLLWMTAARWESWASTGGASEYVLRRDGNEYIFLASSGDRLVWSSTPTPFIVADWAPEACPVRGMTSSGRRYEDAVGEVTFTMTTYFHVYARSAMFRQSLASVFTHLKEQETYVKEFLVINEWYDRNSLALNNSFDGPTVQQTRLEMLSFFPGCEGMTTAQAAERPKGQKCTFIFKDAQEHGQPKALNILLDLMKTKFWIHFEDDRVFYQDVYISRLLAPMYEHPESCWRRGAASVSALRDRVLRDDGQLVSRRLSGEAQECVQIAGVSLAGRRSSDGMQQEDTFEVKDYTAPTILRNKEYVRELLEHGGFDINISHGWGAFDGIGAVDWPLFTLRPGLHNLTYIKSLEAPLFYGGERGRFSEDHRITTWRSGGSTYHYNWNFELEFAVRWARGGATFATLSPGACMRDISNGISSFEKNSDDR